MAIIDRKPEDLKPTSRVIHHQIQNWVWIPWWGKLGVEFWDCRTSSWDPVRESVSGLVPGVVIRSRDFNEPDEKYVSLTEISELGLELWTYIYITGRWYTTTKGAEFELIYAVARFLSSLSSFWSCGSWLSAVGFSVLAEVKEWCMGERRICQ